ncbi:hypothetical protein [Alicyclobacillus fodiniaquatilis]|uniref:Uncharacterized protein n=1 Tax=Alicyclobacillus fodiniaquatilis TaxID=1661150 RepID=A0ABW4JM90_9BACL
MDFEEPSNLILTNDLDSHWSCKIGEQVKGYKINYFYDFSKVYRINESALTPVGMDVSLCKGRCWDNHVAVFNGLYNKQSANINNLLGISRENYTDKYALSTLLQLISYYKAIDFRSLTDEQKIGLWVIDSAYLGHYKKAFQKTHNEFIEILELQELATVLDKYRLIDFERFKLTYNTNGEIWITSDGTLETDIDLDGLQKIYLNVDLSLPTEKFSLFKEYGEPVELDVSKRAIYRPKGTIVSIAYTRKNIVKYTPAVV